MIGSPTAPNGDPYAAGEDWVLAAARARASIGHPHLIRARLERGGSRPALVTELCPAPTLAQQLAERPLPVRDAVAVIGSVASAVEALAAHGLAPRELSPESIHLHHRRRAVLADTGVPGALVPRAHVVAPAARRYLSPEELGGDPPMPGSLVYTLGAILRDSVPEDAPKPLRSVIDRATAQRSDNRYEHPGAFVAAAEAAIPGPMVPAPGVIRPQPRVAPAPPRATVRPERARRPRKEQPTRGARLRTAVAKTAVAAAALAPKLKAPRLKVMRLKVPPQNAPTLKAPPQNLPTVNAPPLIVLRVKAPPLRLPTLRLPSVNVPSLRLPTLRLPRVNVPSLRLPTLRLPRVNVPSLRLPTLRLPRVNVPRLKLPRVNVPWLKLPSVNLPSKLSSLTAGHVAAAGAALVAAAGATAIAATLDGGDAAAPSVSSDVLTVDLPSGWEPSRVPGTRGMALTSAVATSSSEEHARLVVGLARDSAQVRRLVGAAAAEGASPRNVQLGGLEAQRWTNARVSRDTPATLFLGYTSRGPLVAICHRQAGGISAHSAPCSAVLETLRLTGPRPVSLGSVEQIRRGLRSALSVLGEDRIEGRQALATAPLAAGQADAAESLARSFSFAAQTIAAIPTPPGTTDLSGVVGALDATAGAYGGLADAILGGDPVDFDVAKQQILDDEAGLQRNVAAAAIP